ncbi:MAG: UTRA domain-containing protein [Chromatiales bacterium]|nr:UTRA domain-containing protein [Chromatiales bacterium]
MHVECLHYANDVPFQFEERWINLAVVPEAEAEPFLEQPPNIWLLERKPWSNVEHVISAMNSTARTARRRRECAGTCTRRRHSGRALIRSRPHESCALIYDGTCNTSIFTSSGPETNATNTPDGAFLGSMKKLTPLAFSFAIVSSKFDV